MVVLGTKGLRVKSSKEASAAGAQAFVAKVDANSDGELSASEIEATNHRRQHTTEEMVSFHDINNDGVVSNSEVIASWAMFSAAARSVKSKRNGHHDEF